MEHGFSMDKLELKQTILNLLEQKQQIAHSSVQRAVESATDEQTVPEHKYDTFALEASYLAHGQARRVNECAQEIRLIRDLVLPSQYDKVVLGSLVTLLDLDGISQYFFVSPCAGGLKVQVDDCEIMLVTFQSPLGSKLKGKSIGDEVTYKVALTTFCYEIENIS